MTTLLLLKAVGAAAVMGLHAAVVACEAALVKVRFSHFNPDLLDYLRERKAVAWLLDHPTRTLRVLRLTAGLCWVGYWLLLWGPLGMILDAVPGPAAAANLALAAAVVALLGLQLVSVEHMPRSLGLQAAPSVLRGTALLVRVLAALFKPFLGTLAPLGRSLNMAGGGKEVTELEALDYEEQIEMLGKDAPDMSVVAQTILRNALQMRDLEVSDVLLPRNQIKFFDLYLSLQENLQMARESGHTRFPLCEGDLDRCIGLIHIKDLFRYEGELSRVDLRKIKRDIIRIHGETPLEEALTQLLSHNVHMALVIDEFRGTEGVLTLERVLEQLVGDIRDEFDNEEETLIRDTVEGETVVSGLTPLHELAERLGVEVDNDEVSTLGGLITNELGRIPEEGEELVVEGLAVRVTAVDEKRVIEAEVRPLPEDMRVAEDEKSSPSEEEEDEKKQS
ncbi:MAG: hemolysin family protein [Verrucomicrobiota bacterium JB022]|nr:hemolysin family protein [Verrucomicrobiota bacterium JB022]